MLPTLVYMAREKRAHYHHNFKAGAMNALVHSRHQSFTLECMPSHFYHQHPISICLVSSIVPRYIASNNTILVLKISTTSILIILRLTDSNIYTNPAGIT